jgi:hypothetical protein
VAIGRCVARAGAVGLLFGMALRAVGAPVKGAGLLAAYFVFEAIAGPWVLLHITGPAIALLVEAVRRLAP